MSIVIKRKHQDGSRWSARLSPEEFASLLGYDGGRVCGVGIYDFDTEYRFVIELPDDHPKTVALKKEREAALEGTEDV